MNVHIDDTKYDQIVRWAVRSPTTRHIEIVPSVFFQERRSSSGPRYYTVAVDGLEHQTNAYAVRAYERHIDLYLRSTAQKPHSYPLRLMREAMIRTYEDHGGVVFHAAGTDLAGEDVMICGPRSAGKTTLLTCLLRLTRGALLSNDRLILEPSGRLIAVPLPVPIAKGTIDAVTELRSATPRLSRPQQETSELPGRFGATIKAEFSPREYTAALGTTRAPGSWLRTIMVARLTDDSAPARMRELPREHTRQVLAANCFTPHDEFWQQPWLVPRMGPDSELQSHAEQLTQRTADHIRCFEVAFGVRNPLGDLDNALLNLLEQQR